MKGERASTGPGKEELQLRATQRTAVRTGDPKVLNVVLAKLPGVEHSCCGNTDSNFFCSRPQISTKTGSLRFGNK
jgi:hypothetical protein